MTVAAAIFWGVVALLAGTIPRNLLFAANLRAPTYPWAVPLVGAWLWLYWRFLSAPGDSTEAARQRREALRANRLPPRVWFWALAMGGSGLVALVLGLRVVNRLVALPRQDFPDLSGVPSLSIAATLIMSAASAGVVEEASFRGIMQRPIEGRLGVVAAVLITGTMFGLVHLDFTVALWPYYLAVAALYGAVSYLTDSILPAIVLHTAGNLYSNFDLWLRGRAEWQAAAAGSATGFAGLDRAFWTTSGAAALAIAATVAAGVVLRRVTRRQPSGPTAG